MFSSKMVNFTGIWNFSLSLYHFTGMDIYLIAAGTTWAQPSSSGQLQRRGDDGYIHLANHSLRRHLHEAWQRPLRTYSILDRLHPIGFSRGGV